MSAVTHIAGVDVCVDGRYIRQRCSWCGEVLVDQDLTLIMHVTQAEHDQISKACMFEIGDFVRVETDGGFRVSSVVTPPDEGRYPPGTCFVDVAPVVRALADVGDEQPTQADAARQPEHPVNPARDGA